MASSAENLLTELIHFAEASGGKMLERRLADTAVWFHNNKSRVPRDNLAARQAMLETALWTLVEVQALMTERLHELESIKTGSKLWLPRGMKVNGANEFS